MKTLRQTLWFISIPETEYKSYHDVKKEAERQYCEFMEDTVETGGCGWTGKEERILFKRRLEAIRVARDLGVRFTLERVEVRFVCED